jgi:hypothetical protein
MFVLKTFGCLMCVLTVLIVVLTGDATVGMLISYFNFDPSRRFFAKNQQKNAPAWPGQKT